MIEFMKGFACGLIMALVIIIVAVIQYAKELNKK